MRESCWMVTCTICLNVHLVQAVTSEDAITSAVTTGWISMYGRWFCPACVEKIDDSEQENLCE